MTPSSLRALCASVVSISALSYGAGVIHRNQTPSHSSPQMEPHASAWRLMYAEATQ